MNQVTRLKRSRKTRSKPLSPLQIATRFLALSAVLGLLAVAGALVARSLSQHGDATAIQFNLGVNPALGPVEAAALGSYLTLNQEALNTPASEEDATISFEVTLGETGEQIASNLLATGLIPDTTLFRYYLRYYGLDSRLEAGVYQLSPTMTIPEIAIALTDASPAEITVQIPEGWRREQIAEYFDTQADVPFSGAEFLVATGAGAALPTDLSIAAGIPPGVSLDGFLFPDTYRIATDADAEDLVHKMLENLDAQVTAQMRQDAAAHGLTLYQALTLAAIVEREAVVPEERPTIASVYLNRLAINMKLEADPTVQYAMGYQSDTGQWWNLELTQAHYRTVESPYNTYLYPGLPPGPIANPGLSSIMAVIYPADTPYLFFRAACDGSGRHLFAMTFEEHVANECP